MSALLRWRKCLLFKDCLLLVFCFSLCSTTDIVVNPNKEVTHLEHFWKSTGFCPPLPHNASGSWFNSEDMTQNLLYIGSLPNGAIENIRIHYLMEAVTITGFKENVPLYNFKQLDTLVETLWSNGLKPGFELMGNPSTFFTDFENKTQVEEWRRLVGMTAKRYIAQYGLSYVQRWNFESWNEPRRNAFSPMNMTIQGFLNYYDACDAGLRDAHPSLILGAPGGELKGSFSLGSYSWALVNHIVNGKNYFTGKTGSRVDFISVHKKGDEPDNTAAIFDKEVDVLNQLKMHLPELLKKPIYNDEGDPLVAWDLEKWWRQDATYSAMAVKVIVSHQNMWLSDSSKRINFALLSNDDGFMSYNPHFFSQQTLLARFQMNNTQPHHVQMIRKPIYTVMGLLSFLGDTEITAQVRGNASGLYRDLDVLASVAQPSSLQKQNSWEMSAIIYYSKDTHNVTGSVDVTLYITAVKNATLVKDCMYTVYSLDNTHGNPVRVWEKAGKPKSPSWQQFADMRDNEEPVRTVGPSSIDVSVDQKLKLTLALPGVALLHICAKPPAKPNQVSSLSVHGITAGQVLLYWEDSCVHSKCLKTYELEFCPTTRAGPFIRINPTDSVFNSFVHAPKQTHSQISDKAVNVSVRGFYRVRAVDYWGRAGQYSLLVQF